MLIGYSAGGVSLIAEQGEPWIYISMRLYPSRDFLFMLSRGKGWLDILNAIAEAICDN